MSNYLTIALSALTLAFAAQSATAAPITVGSQLSTGGTLYVVGGDGSVANATGLDFAAGATVNPGVDGALTGYTGGGALTAFNCLPGMPCGGISDLLSFGAFNGDTSFLYGSSGGMAFSFSLDAPLTITRVPGTATAAAALIISGTGIMSFDGFDPTAGLFTLVTLNNTEGVTTYSATLFSEGVGVIPEPSSILLMGLGIVAVLVARRKSAS